MRFSRSHIGATSNRDSLVRNLLPARAERPSRQPETLQSLLAFCSSHPALPPLGRAWPQNPGPAAISGGIVPVHTNSPWPKGSFPLLPCATPRCRAQLLFPLLDSPPPPRVAC